jgi:DNA-binding transcriptional LysR family regulator
LPAILRANSALELELKVDDVGLDLGAEGIDIAIRFGPLERSPGVIAKRLVTFPWVLVATRRYVEFMGEPRSVQDLEAHHHIGFRDPETGQLMSWQFQDPSDGTPIRVFPRKRLVVEDMSVA